MGTGYQDATSFGILTTGVYVEFAVVLPYILFFYFMVHQDRNLEPVNWQPPKSNCKANLKNGILQITGSRRNPPESLEVEIHRTYMIVGHTPVDGIKLIGKKQLIVSSSYSRGKKAYVELDLREKIEDARDLLKMVRYIGE